MEKIGKKLRNIETLKTLSNFSIYWLWNIEFNTMSMLKIKTLKTYSISMSMSIFSMFQCFSQCSMSICRPLELGPTLHKRHFRLPKTGLNWYNFFRSEDLNKNEAAYFLGYMKAFFFEKFVLRQFYWMVQKRVGGNFWTRRGGLTAFYQKFVMKLFSIKK